ncbi:MAG: hypothetical protein AAF620_00340 [Bacteroidota bacterium]
MRLLHKGECEFSFEVCFDLDCFYRFLDINDSEKGINRLFGLSYGLRPWLKGRRFVPAHKKDAVWIGWKPSRFQNLIQLFLCCYQKGVGECHYLTSMCIAGEQYYLQVVYNRGALKCVVIDTELMLEVASLALRGIYLPVNNWGYLLYPHLAKKAPTSRKMNIHLNKIKLFK